MFLSVTCEAVKPENSKGRSQGDTLSPREWSQVKGWVGHCWGTEALSGLRRVRTRGVTGLPLTVPLITVAIPIHIPRAYPLGTYPVVARRTQGLVLVVMALRVLTCVPVGGR